MACAWKYIDYIVKICIKKSKQLEKLKEKPNPPDYKREKITFSLKWKNRTKINLYYKTMSALSFH